LPKARATHQARRRRFSSKIAGHTSILWIARRVKVTIGVYEDQCELGTGAGSKTRVSELLKERFVIVPFAAFIV
jgi:hypothetical protein